MNTVAIALLLAASSVDAVTYTFKLYISDAEYADSNAIISVAFCTKSEGCTKDELRPNVVAIKNGVGFGEVIEAAVDIDAFPTGIMFTTSNTNAWGFWKMELDCWTLATAPTGEAAYSYPSEDACFKDEPNEECNWWLDSGSDSTVFEEVYVDFVAKGVVEGADCTIPGAEPPPPQPSCECTGVVVPSDIMDAADLADTYGSSCKAWDSMHCSTFWPTSITGDDSWCCANWCYVDPNCATAEPSWTGLENLAFSYAACEDDEKLMADCNWAGGELSSCAPTGEARTDAAAGELAGSYGSSCKAWDSMDCGELWDEDALWCCESWAYVSAACPYGQPGWVEDVSDSMWWSPNNMVCPDNPALMDNCPWGGYGDMNPCAPTGQARQDEAVGSLAGAYGSSCKAWDSINCYEFWAEDAQWCCESWAYVDAACPYGLPGWVEDVSDAMWWSQNNKVCPDDAMLMAECPWGGMGSMSSCPGPACPYPKECPAVCYEGIFDKMRRKLKKLSRGLLFGKMPEPVDCKAKGCI